jgi:hypothetical protein
LEYFHEKPKHWAFKNRGSDYALIPESTVSLGVHSFSQGFINLQTSASFQEWRSKFGMVSTIKELEL